MNAQYLSITEFKNKFNIFLGLELMVFISIYTNVFEQHIVCITYLLHIIIDIDFKIKNYIFIY